MSQSNFKQKEISQILFKANFKAFWQSEGFQRCGFLYPPLPSRDFMPPKSPGLIGLIFLYISSLGEDLTTDYVIYL